MADQREVTETIDQLQVEVIESRELNKQLLDKFKVYEQKLDGFSDSAEIIKN